MIKKVLVIIFLVISIILLADEFKVNSFNEIATDLAARKEARKDVNDEICAIIKIRTDLDGLIFDTSLRIEGDIEHKTGEFWIYVSPGEKQLRISKSGFIPLIYNIPMLIKSQTVYDMVVTQKELEDENANTTGYLLLTITPEDGEVWIDGEFKGKNYQFELLEGSYEYEIKKELYHSQKGNLNISRNETNEIELDLDPNFGSLSVNSTSVNNAQIFLDGQDTGKTTPATIDRIVSGTHKIVLKREMYEEMEQSFTIKDNKETELQLKLNPLFAGISITTEPEADIYIDNMKMAMGSYSENLVEGTYNISIKKDMYESINEQIIIVKGNPTKKHFKLIPIFGVISISTEPPSDIHIDGKKVGNFNFSTRLISGIHTLEAKKEKYYTTTKKIDVKVDSDETYVLNLEPITGILSIMTSPPKAEIYLNGKMYGKTPKIIDHLIIGKYDVELKKSGYADKELAISIVENQKEAINESLNDAVSIMIKSDPLGADIFLNDKKVGKTPDLVDFSLGRNRIVLKKNDYKDKTETVNISANSNMNDLNYQLLPETVIIDVKSKPKGADIYVDGVKKGKTNKKIELRPGKHQINLVKEGFNDVFLEKEFYQNSPFNAKLNVDKLFLDNSKEYFRTRFPGLFPIEVNYSNQIIGISSSLISGRVNRFKSVSIKMFEFSIYSDDSLELEMVEGSKVFQKFINRNSFISLMFNFDVGFRQKKPFKENNYLIANPPPWKSDYLEEEDLEYIMGMFPLGLNVSYTFPINQRFGTIGVKYKYYFFQENHAKFELVEETGYYTKVDEYNTNWSGLYVYFQFHPFLKKNTEKS